jgi:hypothetical protein
MEVLDHAHTEPPTDETIRECYMKFQHGDCLCTVKCTGRALAISQDWWACARNIWQVLNMSPRVDILSTCKVVQKLGVYLPLLTYSPLAWPSRLLYCRGLKSRTGLWITLNKLTFKKICTNCMLSFGWFTSICSLNANLSEHSVFHLHSYSPMKKEQCPEMLAFNPLRSLTY